MVKRTTIEIEEELLARAKKALGGATARMTVDEALRRLAKTAEDEHERRAEAQRHYLKMFSAHVDLGILASGDMWL